MAEPARLLRADSELNQLIAPAWQDGQALKHAECSICFEPLSAGPVGVFLNQAGKRVSPHFFNLEAAREWLRSGNGHCPLTRQRIASVAAVPDVREDPKGWWKVVDVDGDGKLSRHEVLEALKAQLPINSVCASPCRASAIYRGTDQVPACRSSRGALTSPHPARTLPRVRAG
jgi:hypothetical protein